MAGRRRKRSFSLTRSHTHTHTANVTRYGMSSRAEFGGILFDFLASEIHDRFLPPFAATQRARVSSYVGPWHSKNSKPCLCSHKCARKLDRGAAAAAAAASYQSSAIVGRKILGLRIFVCRCADPIQSSRFQCFALRGASQTLFFSRAGKSTLDAHL